MLGMRTCLPCHIPDRWSRNANWIWPDLAFGFIQKRSGNDIMAEAVRQFLVLYDKSRRDFKDNSKKRLAWDDVAKQVRLQTSMYSSSEYSFTCSMFSLVRVMLLYGSSFLGFFVWVLITVVLCLVPLQTSSSSYENKKQWQKQQSLVISRVRHLECLQMKARLTLKTRLTLKARLTIPLPSCQFTLDQNFLPIPTSLTTPLPSLLLLV